MYPLLRFGPGQIYVQQAVFQRGVLNLHAVRQDEASDKAAGGDTPMQEGLIGLARGGVTLAGDHQLAILDRDLQLVG